MNYEVPITQIHQIELTSRCNLRCIYCPHGQDGVMKRPQVDMTWATFERALMWVDHFCREGTQAEVNLAGLGESTLNPMFAEMVLATRATLGVSREIHLATNGIAITKQMVEKIASARPKVWVSTHKPEKIVNAISWLREAGLLAGISCDGAINPNDWAGQVKWVKPTYELPCYWLTLGWGFITAEGKIPVCCIDADGKETFGDVWSAKLGPLRPIKLCKSCYQRIPNFDKETL